MTSAMIVRTSPSVPGDVRNVDFELREEITIRHTRQTEPIFQNVFHAENSYGAVGNVDLDCSQVSTIEIILASIKGGIVIVHEDTDDHTGTRRIIPASER